MRSRHNALLRMARVLEYEPILYEYCQLQTRRTNLTAPDCMLLKRNYGSTDNY
jgi:hypothetical protein